MTDPAAEWTPEHLADLCDRFEGTYPEDALHWGIDTFGSGLVMATGFGPSGVVLMHMTSRIKPDMTVFYIDTDLLFPETHDLKRRLADELGIRFTRVHSGLSLQDQGRREQPSLWRTNPDRCCSLRKVQPLREFLSDKSAWITGIRRDQSPTRSRIGIIEWDRANGLVKINPLVSWTEKDVWSYMELYDLPYNPLHDRGYPSIGCIPCTKAVADGEDLRAGRWRGHNKLECGIHLANMDRPEADNLIELPKSA